MAELSFEAKGRCACGALSYRLMRAPMFVHCCHCTQCQRLTGSAFVLNAIIENDAIEVLSGDITVTPGPVEGAGVHDVYRCVACQTAVWSDYGRRRNYRFVRVGTLDQPGRVPPNVHIFTRSKLPWVVIPEDQPAFEGFYDLHKTWPAEMLIRRQAALS